MKLLAFTFVFALPFAALVLQPKKALAKSPGCDPEIHVCSYAQDASRYSNVN